MELSDKRTLRSPFSLGPRSPLAHEVGGPGMPHARSGYEQETVYPSSGTLKRTKRAPMATLASTEPPGLLRGHLLETLAAHQTSFPSACHLGSCSSFFPWEELEFQQLWLMLLRIADAAHRLP